jgi:putative PIN family toxin of toxin-antitoxin system
MRELPFTKKNMAKKRIKVFLDSNVILSGLLSDKGAPRIILDILSLDLPIISGATGRYNIIEIERNLKKKMPHVIPVYKKYLPVINLEIVPMPSLKTINDLTGQIADKDVPVLASAIMSNADYLVTGDKKDFSRIRTKGKYPFEILGPSEFLQNVVHKILNI